VLGVSVAVLGVSVAVLGMVVVLMTVVGAHVLSPVRSRPP
jgi:hypothetical protein